MYAHSRQHGQLVRPALELFPADEQQLRQIGLDLAVAVALRPVVSVALPHSEPAVLPTPAWMVAQPSQEGSCMLVEYCLLGNLAQFDKVAFGAAYAVEIGVDPDSVQLVAVRAADRVVQLSVQLQHTEHRDATVRALHMGCRLRAAGRLAWLLRSAPSPLLVGK